MATRRPINSSPIGQSAANGRRKGNFSEGLSVDRKRKRNQSIFMNENDYRRRLQEGLYTREHILSKIFRKDGPTLGDEFDSLPANAFKCDPGKSRHDEKRRASKKRKALPQHTVIDYQTCCESSLSTPQHGIGKGLMTSKGVLKKRHGMGKGLMTQMGPATKKHGMGKGLMTQMGAATKKHGMGKGLITQQSYPMKKYGMGKSLMTDWPNVNPYAREYPRDASSGQSTIQKKKRAQQRQTIAAQLANKAKAKKRTSVRSKKAEDEKLLKRKNPCKKKCELALEDVKCLENMEHIAKLLEDEELELKELRAGSNPVSCSEHFPSHGSHGCSLCKDLLAKFPPNSVSMKLPLFTQPWISAPGLVKKLFKVFQFLSTYAVTISIHSFTFDEFARSFHEKDSLLLGHLHMALLKILLSDTDKELSRGFLPHASKNCKFSCLLHSLEHHAIVLEFWQKSLNLLTWIEILRQVFVAAGFGSKLGLASKEVCRKEVNLLEKYGLCTGTLKGELLSILSAQGNVGMKVSELAQSASIAEMNLADALPDLENLISSALSTDVTLFEKISLSGYRLRIHATKKECEVCDSDSDEDFGSIDEIAEITWGRDTADASEDDSREFSPSRLELDVNQPKPLTVFHEIDESQPGEPWLLGLMEGEYSDLSIDEKLNVLTSLIDLLSAGSSIRMEDPPMSNAECPPISIPYCSGAKIKRSTARNCNSIGQPGDCGGQTVARPDVNPSEQPIDSLVPMSKISKEQQHANMKKIAEQMETVEYLHSMQSIFLGSDRRYNRYWLFLGPCDEHDPGHRRLYFESSEDGHWEIIDTQEALSTLLSALDQRGVREAHLLASLQSREAILCEAMSTSTNRQVEGPSHSEQNSSRSDSSSPVSDVDNRSGSTEIPEIPPGLGVVDSRKKANLHMEKSANSRAFDVSLWKTFYLELNTVKCGKKSHLDILKRCEQCQDLYWKDEKHCRICHITFELGFDLEEKYAVHSAVCRANTVNTNRCRNQRVLSSQLQALKAAIYAIESVIPDDALSGSWRRSAHNLWVNRLRRASSLTEFLQVLADLITAINEYWFYENDVSGSSSLLDEIFSNFSTTPQTYSAVALWLVKLDLVVASHVKTGHTNLINGCRQIGR